MKKRILAAILIVAMLFSVCTIVSAEWTQKEGTDVLAFWDFNDASFDVGHQSSGGNNPPEYSADGGVDGSRCFYMQGGWKVYPTNMTLFQAEAGKSYQISAKYKGSLYQFILRDTTPATTIEYQGAPTQANWTELSVVYTAQASSYVSLTLFSGGEECYVDDIKVIEVVDNSAPQQTQAPEEDDNVNSDKEAKILCIGDSITHGCGANDSTRYFTSYRYPLWKKLIDAGVKFEMVGPREGNLDASCVFENYKGQTFNNKHYAQFGVKLETMKGTIGTDCANTDFNVAIINLGTNDRRVNGDTEIAWTCENIPAWLAEMTNTLRTINPNVTVFLTGLLDSWPGGLNEAIKSKAEAITTTQSPVHYVPAPTGWIADTNNPNTCTLDWCHPNEKGCQMMADTYFNALIEKYFKAEPVTDEPTPIPDVENTSSPSAIVTTAPTAAVTVTPSSTATVAPSASATVDNGTTAKKSIKFKKKKVTIKKGKKATLKVTIKGAKKAKFSVNKKGKKVVKLSKKKAKSVVVTGKKKGKATITAKSAGKKATCKITVK